MWYCPLVGENFLSYEVYHEVSGKSWNIVIRNVTWDSASNLENPFVKLSNSAAELNAIPELV